MMRKLAIITVVSLLALSTIVRADVVYPTYPKQYCDTQSWSYPLCNLVNSLIEQVNRINQMIGARPVQPPVCPDNTVYQDGVCVPTKKVDLCRQAGGVVCLDVNKCNVFYSSTGGIINQPNLCPNPNEVCCAQPIGDLRECKSAKDCWDKFHNCYYACQDDKCVPIYTILPLNPYPDCGNDIPTTTTTLAQPLPQSCCNKPVVCPDGMACMPNPASAFCKCLGGDSQIMTASGGGQYGICMLNGGQYDEWKLYNEKCPTTTTTTSPIISRLKCGWCGMNCMDFSSTPNQICTMIAVGDGSECKEVDGRCTIIKPEPCVFSVFGLSAFCPIDKICEPGTQKICQVESFRGTINGISTCLPDGSGWGECKLSTAPNGNVCKPGTRQNCIVQGGSKMDITGTQVCNTNGEWGVCVPMIYVTAQV